MKIGCIYLILCCCVLKCECRIPFITKKELQHYSHTFLPTFLSLNMIKWKYVFFIDPMYFPLDFLLYFKSITETFIRIWLMKIDSVSTKGICIATLDCWLFQRNTFSLWSSASAMLTRLERPFSFQYTKLESFSRNNSRPHFGLFTFICIL